MTLQNELHYQNPYYWWDRLDRDLDLPYHDQKSTKFSFGPGESAADKGLDDDDGLVAWFSYWHSEYELPINLKKDITKIFNKYFVD